MFSRRAPSPPRPIIARCVWDIAARRKSRGKKFVIKRRKSKKTRNYITHTHTHIETGHLSGTIAFPALELLWPSIPTIIIIINADGFSEMKFPNLSRSIFLRAVIWRQKDIF